MICVGPEDAGYLAAGVGAGGGVDGFSDLRNRFFIVGDRDALADEAREPEELEA